jgi:hypothetical protein
VSVGKTSDKALGLMLPVANTAGMIEHLRLISQATAKDRQALVIVDRAGWHMTKAIRSHLVFHSKPDKIFQ